ncbi:15384_t:CDS:2 [Entrophospora sp. SA101]|nr:15384_t:CDS:2 [Entrophospora sp. SA101]
MPSPQSNYQQTPPPPQSYQISNYPMYAPSPPAYLVQQSQSPVQIETSIIADLVPSPLVSSPPKKPKLRVKIPEASDKQSSSNTNQQTTQQQQQSQSQDQSQDQSPEQPSETPADSQQPTTSQPLQSSRPTPATADAPTSALTSFAQNLPSPSTFFSEFYKTTELPSPLTFGNTPTSAQPGPFHWPNPNRNSYQPSPLSKQENNTNIANNGINVINNNIGNVNASSSSSSSSLTKLRPPPIDVLEDIDGLLEEFAFVELGMLIGIVVCGGG